MKAGPMRHPVEIERRDQGLDTLGQPVNTWSTVASVFAAITPAAGGAARKLFPYLQEGVKITHAVSLRYIEDIRSGDRVKHRSRYLYVVAPFNMHERDRETLLACEERIDEDGT